MLCLLFLDRLTLISAHLLYFEQMFFYVDTQQYQGQQITFKGVWTKTFKEGLQLLLLLLLLLSLFNKGILIAHLRLLLKR